MRLGAARLAAAPLALLAGCNPPAAPPPDNVALDAAENALDNGAGPRPEPKPVLPIPDRLGPVAIGMKAGDIPGLSRDEPMPGSSCGYAKLASLPDIFLMLDGDTVVRVDVRTPDYPAVAGVKVGDSEASALKALGDAVKVQPHPYTGPTGHYLVVHPDGAPNGLILETEETGKTIRSYRFGRWEQVQWIEGCA